MEEDRDRQRGEQNFAGFNYWFGSNVTLNR